MSPLTQELAEQELARASITEEADEWIGSEEEEEDASASASASAYFDASAAFAAASISTSALGARLREEAEGLDGALLKLHAAKWACREADKEAADAYEAHRLILSEVRRCAEWTASLKVRNLRLQMLTGRVGPGAGPGLRYNLHRAQEQGKELLAL
jgi:hypothetical protein